MAANNTRNTPELGYVSMVAGSGLSTTILGTVQALQAKKSKPMDLSACDRLAHGKGEVGPSVKNGINGTTTRLTGDSI